MNLQYHMHAMKTTQVMVLLHIFQNNHLNNTDTGSLCDVSMTGSEPGYIHHPNFPFAYRQNLNCEIRIDVSHDMSSTYRTVCLVFHRFSLQPCGSNAPDSLTVTGDRLTVAYCGSGEAYSQPSTLGELGSVWSSRFCCKYGWCVFNFSYSARKYHL